MSGEAIFTAMVIGGCFVVILGYAFAEWRKEQDEHVPQPATDRPKLPHVPPMTATWPARVIGVNGFRYVLEDRAEVARDFELAIGAAFCLREGIGTIDELMDRLNAIRGRLSAPPEGNR